MLLAVVLSALIATPSGADVAPEAHAPAVGRDAPTAACTENPFAGGFAADLARRYPGRRITAAVHDAATGCDYSFRPDLRITTASVAKIQIMAGVLLRAQREGRGLTASERALIAPMIRDSADPPASALWSSIGGVAGMAALDRDLGLTETTAAQPWGLTLTSARDRNLLLRQLLLGDGGPFDATSRATARSFMLDINPAQRWGVRTGIPSSWRAPMKNGFFISRCCRWRLNTSGVVERPGRGAYVMTVLSDGWPTDREGIAAVDHVAGVIADWTAANVGPHPSASRYVHRLYHDVLGRPPSYPVERIRSAAVGVTGSGAAAVGAEVIGSGELDRQGGVVLRMWLGTSGTLPSHASYARRSWQLRTGRLTPATLGAELVGPLLGAGADMGSGELVDLVSTRVLGRILSPPDRAWWIARVDAGLAPGALLAAFTESAESRWSRWSQVRLAEAFLALLRRPPSAGDVARWAPTLTTPAAAVPLVAMILRSAEHARRW